MNSRLTDSVQDMVRHYVHTPVVHALTAVTRVLDAKVSVGSRSLPYRLLYDLIDDACKFNVRESVEVTGILYTQKEGAV